MLLPGLLFMRILSLLLLLMLLRMLPGGAAGTVRNGGRDAARDSWTAADAAHVTNEEARAKVRKILEKMLKKYI